MLRTAPQQQAAQAAQQAAHAAIQAAQQLGSQSPRPQQFQRLRSLPQPNADPSSACGTARSSAFGATELDRSRRGTNAQSMRASAGGGPGSGRVPAGPAGGNNERRVTSG